MKKLFSTLLATVLAFGAANAQTVLMSETFGAGIPAGWGHTGSSANGPSAAARFKWTTNQVAGSGGRYGSSYGTISSPTKANGYISFDSDSLDEGGGNGSMGNGPAPGPQTCQLTTTAINVAGYSRVSVSFWQYLAQFQGNTYVAYSTDSINWVQDTLNADQVVNTASDLANEKITKDVSSIIAGHNNLFIRFTWEGSYYFWAIDDINVIEIPNNDLVVTSFANQSLTSEGLGLAFSVYPVTQIDSITPVVFFSNAGRAAETNVTADITVKKGNTTVSTYSSTPIFGVVPAGVDTVDAATMGIAGVGSYKSIVYVHSLDSVDYDPSNNTDSFAFTVNDSIFSINSGSASGGYYMLRNNYGLDYRYGTIFEVLHDDTVTSVTTAFIGGGTGNTKAGSIVQASIYPVTVGTGLSYSPAVVSTVQKTLAAGDIGTATSLRPTSLRIDNASGNAVLTPGLYYVSIRGVQAGDSNIVVQGTGYQTNGFPVVEDASSIGTLYYFSSSDAVYCNLNFGHVSSLLYADFTRTPGVNPLRAYQPVVFTATVTTASPAATYDWTFTGSPNVGYAYNNQSGRIVRDTFTNAVDDTINVCLTVTDGPATASTCKSVRVRAVGVGVEDISPIANVSMVPNPTTGKVTISADGITGATTVTFTNAIGQEVKRFDETANGSFQKAYNLTDLAGGLYIVKIQNGNNISTNRLSISK